MVLWYSTCKDEFSIVVSCVATILGRLVKAVRCVPQPVDNNTKSPPSAAKGLDKSRLPKVPCLGHAAHRALGDTTNLGVRPCNYPFIPS